MAGAGPRGAVGRAVPDRAVSCPRGGAHGCGGRSTVAALQAAGRAGILVVASAGNNGVNTDLSPSYPASYGNSSARMSSAEYDRFNGWLAHLHVSGNAHGDITLDAPRLKRAVDAQLGRDGGAQDQRDLVGPARRCVPEEVNRRGEQRNEHCDRKRRTETEGRDSEAVRADRQEEGVGQQRGEPDARRGV